MFLLQALPDPIPSHDLGEGEPKRGTVGAFALLTGVILFEYILRIERWKAGGREDDPLGLAAMDSTFDAMLGSATNVAGPSRWYKALRGLVEDEVQIEQNVDSLFEEITLV